MKEEVCPICKNKRHVFKEGKGWVRCECYYQMRLKRILSKAKFPLALFSVEAEDFIMTSPQSRELGAGIQEKVNKFSWEPYFIFSNTTKKEIAAAVIVKNILRKNMDVEVVSYESLDKLVGEKFSKDKDGVEEDYLSSDILVLSIGKEITNSAHKNLLYNIIYDRIVNQRFLLLLSDISKASIQQIYSDKVWNLMQESFKFYEC